MANTYKTAPHRVELTNKLNPKTTNKAPLINAPANKASTKPVVTVRNASPISMPGVGVARSAFNLLKNAVGRGDVKRQRDANQMAMPSMKSSSKGPRG